MPKISGLTENACFSLTSMSSLLCLAGFGNLQGNMEFWDTRNRKLINQVKAADSTFFEWSPDGEHILTATCSPRLRVGNG